MWSSEQTLSLIEEYHKTPCLWDIHSTGYRNRAKKKMAMNKLAEQFDVSINDLEKKIHNLKTQFYREHKKVVREMSRGGPGIASWFAYKPLFFLHQRMELLRKKSNEADEENNGVDGDQRTTELTFDEDCSESERNSPCCTLPQPPAKKLKEADQVERQNELLKLACDLLSTSSKPEESNEFLDIGKVWGTKLMSLDPMQRKFAEKAINEILFEADLGTLHRDSVKINHNPNSDPFESI